ncbi:MAG: primosomal protein N' [Candidatus Izemoplasmatales bacterium]|nr:primosomal protein N' [Candidatus Izemoplasmatales bacterium]
MVAKVLVDVKAKAVNKLYDYAVGQDFENILELGMRVIVSFGSREVMGYVLDIVLEKETNALLKPIIRLLDLESYITKELIDLAYQIEEDTSTVLIKVLETMLPSALKAVYKTSFEVIDENLLPDSLKKVFSGGIEIPFTEEFFPYAKEIKSSLQKGAIKQIYDISSKSNPRTKKIVRFLKELDSYKNDKQKKVIEYIKNHQNESLVLTDLLRNLQVTSSVITTLQKHGALELLNQEQYREILSIQKPNHKEVTLNDEQETAFIKINQKINQYVTFLLHGVTGSGKTEIYIKSIEEVLKSGKEVLFLVPEIALTPMMVNRFKSHFQNQVAILHSGLSIGEKYDEWRKIIRKEVSIVIGARSASFAPFENLGLIIVDECHESTYKQEEMPAYYAVDVLNHRAKHYQIPLILGSATPNIESYARYKRGYYELLTLNHRALNSYEPDIEIIDMKKEFLSGNSELFSRTLVQEINYRLEKKEQVILLLNRRGYSNFVICRNCGYVFSCKDCDISLTYHDTDHTLKCHYCGHKEEVPHECPKCKSKDLRFMGVGTQKIETELAKLFPNSKVIRMDNDTTRTKNAHEKLLDEFEKTGDILLGTQMIAKGLDFPHVTLVGILQADGNLYSPDFRAPEKTFQLITQVAGRAGRHDLKGKVVVQAFNPDHYAIRFAINHDYLGFYEYEMQLRKIAKYSPFYYINQIMLSSENVRDIFLCAREIIKYLRKELSKEVIILGPTLPVISRIKNKYRCLILLKYKNEPNLNQSLAYIKNQFDTDLIYISIDKFPTI